MSSILDALRKSDDKRPQSNKGVDQIKFGESKQEHKSRKGFWFLVLILLLVATAVWAYQGGYLDSIKTMLMGDESTQGVQPTKTNKKQINPEQAQQKNQTNEPSKKQPLATLKPPKPEKIKGQIKKQNETVSEVAKTDKGVDPVNDNQQDTMPVIEQKSSKPSRLMIDGKPVADKAIKEKKAKNTVAENKEADNRTGSSKQKYLLIHQLPFETRKQMPAIKINVHVFDPKPENRMVVINGVSFQVGDSVEELALIKDITAEGVVIEVAGTVFMIPK